MVVRRLGGVGSGFAAMWPPYTHSHRPDRAHRCPWQRVKLPGRGSRRCPRAGDHHWCRELRVEPRVARMSEYTQGGRRAGKRQGLVREGLRDFVEITLPPSCKHSAGAFTPFFFIIIYLPPGTIVGNKAASLPARATSFVCRAEPPHGQEPALCRWPDSYRGVSFPHRKVRENLGTPERPKPSSAIGCGNWDDGRGKEVG